MFTGGAVGKAAARPSSDLITDRLQVMAASNALPW